VWDLERRERASSITVPAWHSYSVRFDPTSARLVLFGGTEPALLVDARSGSSIATLELARSVDGVAFSKDGSRIALGIGNTVQLWTTKEPGRPLFTVSSTPKSSYALSDDGELFATGSLDGQIRIWDSRGRMLDRLVGSQTAITRVEFSGDRLLGQSDDGFSTTWDVHRDKRTRAEIKEFAEKYSNWRLVNVQIVPKL
jgi:WD40 repeat protein